MPKPESERYCELVAALKLRTTNQAGRYLSTKRGIELLEEFGVETAQGLARVTAAADCDSAAIPNDASRAVA